MENNKGQSIFLSVVGIATLLVAIVGATFAFFSIQVTGNQNASSITVNAAVVGAVTYVDGNTIALETSDVYPGWNAQKVFTVSQTTDTANTAIDYYIRMIVGENDFAENTGHEDDLVYSLSGAASNAGGTAIVVPQNRVLATTDFVGKEDNATGIEGTGIYANVKLGRLQGVDVHTYTFKILFKETGEVQDYAQGDRFKISLEVQVLEGQGMRTAAGGDDAGYKSWTSDDNITNLP